MNCSACRVELPYDGVHWECSVSTCNRNRTRLVFCCVGCWDSHVAILRHRESWAVEVQTPSRAEAAAEVEVLRRSADAPAPTRAAAPAPTRAAAASASDDDVLVVVSKVKSYIRERSGMSTSDSVAAALSEHVRRVCDAAIRAASTAGRKTVLDRDVPPAR